MAIRARDLVLSVAAVVVSAVGAYLGYRTVGWLGVGVFGLLVAFIAVQVDLDGAAPIGPQQNGGLFASTIAAQASETRAEQAGRRAEAAARGRMVALFKLIGLLVAIIGGIGFFLFQFPR